MKVVQINTVYKNGGSTGRIVYDLKNTMESFGIESYAAFGYEYIKTNDLNTYKMASIPETKFSILQTRIDGQHGFYNNFQTKKLINWLNTIQPDLIHLHNLHCHYINVELLFNYIKEKNVPVIWTLHDCWAFTGWCAHFDYIGCDKWKTQCSNCANIHEYPFTWFHDRSYDNFLKKKRCFLGVTNMNIITPSMWLSDLVNQSFLSTYPVSVINNGIDLNIFKPVKSNIKNEIGVGNKKMILSMAMGFSKLKGYDYLIELSKSIDENSVLVLAGMEKSQISKLPKGIIGLEKTNDVTYLGKLYSSADVFVNPTLQDTFPTTNLESLACGTPVVTFQTGGSPESIKKDCGIVIEKGNTKELVNAVKYVLKHYNNTNREICIKTANKYFNKDDCFKKYIDKYYEVVGL